MKSFCGMLSVIAIWTMALCQHGTEMNINNVYYIVTIIWLLFVCRQSILQIIQRGKSHACGWKVSMASVFVMSSRSFVWSTAPFRPRKILRVLDNIWFLPQVISASLNLHFLTDTKGIFSVSPEQCDVLPLKTASFRVTFRPVSTN